MRNPFFSIVMPVYNTELALIKRTYDSILNQTYNDFELIIVDDGSKNSVAEFLEELCIDDRSRLLHKENAGVSAARNTGIQMCKGNYIAFVDADDIINCDFLRQAYSYIVKFNPDVVFGQLEFSTVIGDVVNAITNNNCTTENMDAIHINKQNYKGDAVCFNLSSNEERNNIIECLIKSSNRKLNLVLTGSPCGAVYKASVCRKIMFNENIKICEDQIFNYYILKTVDSCAIVPDIWYYYIQNPNSAMHTGNGDQTKYFRYWDELVKIYENEDDCMKLNLGEFFIKLAGNSMKTICCNDTNFMQIRLKMQEICNHPMVNIAVSSNKRSIGAKEIIKKLMLRKRCYLGIYLLYRLKYAF